MISLNGVTLDENLLWTDEFDHPAVSQNKLRTILGNSVIQSMPLSDKGNTITLEARSSGSEYSGSFTKDQISEFKTLEQTGATVILSYEGTSYDVIVQAGGVRVEPLMPRPNQGSTDLYTGTLKLIGV